MFADIRALVERTFLDAISTLDKRPVGVLPEWSVQGLGMLRLYLSRNKTVRLHVWDRSLLVVGAAPAHTHPWDFSSLVVAGRMRNQRYDVVAPDDESLETRGPHVSWWNGTEILCGPGTHQTAPGAERVRLKELDMETYYPGETYKQERAEIHQSFPEDGTVTIVTRTFGPDPDHARVYWRGPEGSPWISAEPHAADPNTVRTVLLRSLETWWS